MKELAAWYQKKISSYDKAEWETLVEQLLVRGTYRRRVVDLTTHIPSSYLIDVDLVRGSSFPKAKATLGVWRVVWLALIRLLLLPGLFRWWRQQTSVSGARVLLALWSLQVLNLLLYFLAPTKSDVECDSVLVPLALMVALSVVHAHIVSTTALELGRVRPGHSARKKLPGSFRRMRRECSGGSPGSAESGATSTHSKAAGVKPAKFRRRPSLARSKEEIDEGLRKRKKTIETCAMTKGTDSKASAKSSKAKDSDDEDYMDWKRPSVSPPTVTFTPPPRPSTEDNPRGSLRQDVLTRRRLENFNVDRNQNRARPSFDGDDGFESLNGNYSNEEEERARREYAELFNFNNFNIRNAIQIDIDIENLEPRELDADVNDLLNFGVLRGGDVPQNGVRINNNVTTDFFRNQARNNAAPYRPDIDPNVFIDDGVKDAVLNEEVIIKAIRNSRLDEAKRNELINGLKDTDDSPPISNEVTSTPSRKEILNKRLKERKDQQSKDRKDSAGGVEDSPCTSKRAGVRFTNTGSWIQDTFQDTSDGASSTKSKNKKTKKANNFQSSSSEGECETASAPSIGLPSHQTMSDWVGQTTNSEECSYSSQSEGSGSDVGYHCNDSTWDPFSILNPASDTVKCMMWEKGEMMKAELSAVDISWCVVARAERAMAADGGYLWAGVAMATAIAIMAPAARLLQVAVQESEKVSEETSHWLLQLPWLLIQHSGGSLYKLLGIAFGHGPWVLTMNVISCFLRFALSGLCFFLLAVAERAYKQRFLYAKLFSHLTSARRARKSELPHFRLHTVRNIKTWLSARSYLRRRGPQRSVDVIVSAAFVVTLTLLACVAAQLLRESVTVESGWLLEVMVWCGCLGVYLLRLLTLGSNINRKYRGCLSAIITEQINLHLAIEQRPHSKDKLTLANNVLKLAADLLKELDAPFKISGICANHYLYTIIKVVILSALSGVLSEMLGFKLKLDKIKIK